MNRNRRRLRRASTYILVLGTSMIVTVIGLSALIVARVNTRTIARDANADEAEVLALSAVEQALSIIETNPGWRDGFTHGIATTEVPFGSGLVSIKLVDLSGDDDIATGADDALRIYGIGRVGDSMRMHSVVMAGTDPMSCLEVAVMAGVSMVIDGNTFDCDQLISANNWIGAYGGVNANTSAEAVSSIYGQNHFTGTVTEGADPRTMPDPNTVFDSYLTSGTTIPITDIPLLAGARKIQNAVLSPASNPYGPTNARGIYVIDCQGELFYVQDSRVVGTIVLLDPGAGSRINGTVNWRPAVPGLPAMLVRGDYLFHFSGSSAGGSLSEPLKHVNFNPAGTPYLGFADNDEDDVYPSVMEGLVYVTGTADMTAPGEFDGVFIVGVELNANSEPTFRYDPTVLNNPPPGFRTAGNLAVSAGSWRWETAD